MRQVYDLLDYGRTSWYRCTGMSDEHLDTLPRRLTFAREHAGLNRTALATKAGLNPSHVRLIEEGEREHPSGTTLAKIAEALGVSLDWLVRGVGDAPVNNPAASGS